MSRPLIVNEAAAGDLRGKGKMRTVVFAHSLQCDNVKEWLDPFIKFSPSQQDPEADHRTSSRTTCNPLPYCRHPARMEAARSGLNRSSWCSGHNCGTEKASVLCLKYKSNGLKHLIRLDHAMPMCRFGCVPHSNTNVKMPIKRVGVDAF